MCSCPVGGRAPIVVSPDDLIQPNAYSCVPTVLCKIFAAFGMVESVQTCLPYMSHALGANPATGTSINAAQQFADEQPGCNAVLSPVCDLGSYGGLDQNCERYYQFTQDCCESDQYGILGNLNGHHAVLITHIDFLLGQVTYQDPETATDMNQYCSLDSIKQILYIVKGRNFPIFPRRG